MLEWNQERVTQQGTQAGLLRRMERQVETDGDSATTEEDQPEDASTIEARLQYQQEELKKENLYLRETQKRLRTDAETLAQEWKGANNRMDAMTKEVRDLRGEVFQLSDAADRGSIGWNGPYDDNIEDEPRPDEVRNPTHEYAESQRQRHCGDPKPASWQEYWRTRAYVSTGRCNKAMKNQDYEDKFRWAGAGEEARRLQPERADHLQVPWFQCIAHACKYHYQSKFDHDHWPVRETLANGTTKPMTWTFDHGQAPTDFLWYFERVDDGKLCFRPRNAWPETCGAVVRTGPTHHCWSTECMWHLQDKAREFHVRQTEQWNWTHQTHGRRRRNSDPAWEQTSQEWLQEFKGDDDAVMENEGDASHNPTHVPTPGDYRRMSDAIRSPQQALGNGSGPSEGPEQH